jgi:hypothetical protein
VITRKLDDLKKEFPNDYEYLTKTLDKLLERNGKYSKIKYSVRENFEEFTK